MSRTLPRLEQLVSVRGLAAWLVVFFHSIALLQIAIPELPSWVFDTIAHGYIAVDFFFVLSGFIIFINYYDRFGVGFWQNATAFYWNRFTRIYPVHFLILFAYLGLAALFLCFSNSKSVPDTYTPTSFIRNLFLIQAWFGESISWNVPSWSISAEWFVYLLFPMQAVLLKKCAHGLVTHLFLALLVLVAIFGISQVQINVEGVPRLTELPLVRAIFEFSLGTIVGSLYVLHQKWLIRTQLVWVAIIIAVAIAIAYLGLSAVLGVPIMCFLVVGALCIDKSPLTKLLSTQPLLYLGEISYSTYMVHYLVYDLYKAIFLDSLIRVDAVSLLISFATVLGLSMIMHKMVEIPAQRFLRSDRVKAIAASVAK